MTEETAGILIKIFRLVTGVVKLLVNSADNFESPALGNRAMGTALKQRNLR